jgi:predicted dehydrogenase
VVVEVLPHARQVGHDLDAVLAFVNSPTKEIRAVGMPILSGKVDIANARLEFESGCVANFTASRVSTERVRKMRFFQPHDYIAVDYATNRATISSLAPPSASGAWPGVQIKNLDIIDVEPLRAEILAFIEAARDGRPSPVSGRDGRNALSLALRALQRIEEHAAKVQVGSVDAQ